MTGQVHSHTVWAAPCSCKPSTVCVPCATFSNPGGGPSSAQCALLNYLAAQMGEGSSDLTGDLPTTVGHCGCRLWREHCSCRNRGRSPAGLSYFVQLTLLWVQLLAQLQLCGVALSDGSGAANDARRACVGFGCVEKCVPFSQKEPEGACL